VIADEFNERGIQPPQRGPWAKNSIWRITRQTCRVRSKAASGQADWNGAKQGPEARR
jgi:hypothetical protein